MTEITQKAFLKGSRRFELADDEDAIRCEYRNGKNLYRFKVPNPSPPWRGVFCGGCVARMRQLYG